MRKSIALTMSVFVSVFLVIGAMPGSAKPGKQKEAKKADKKEAQKQKNTKADEADFEAEGGDVEGEAEAEADEAELEVEGDDAEAEANIESDEASVEGEVGDREVEHESETPGELVSAVAKDKPSVQAVMPFAEKFAGKNGGGFNAGTIVEQVQSVLANGSNMPGGEAPSVDAPASAPSL